ncbi:MAG TPA: hypothetical protein VFF27_11735 [Bacteroidia bacterium]|nr:hypothetical protein [Bacteroidia bacterium]
MNIILEYPWWFLIFCILAGGVYAFALYFKDKKQKEVPVGRRRFMGILRFVAVTILSFLLLSPLIKTVKRTVEKPVVVIAQDNSESLVAGKDSAFYKKEYKEKLAALISKLQDKYDVKTYTFADRIKELFSTDSINYKEKQTNISQLFDELDTRYSNRNLGAVIIATDGLYNIGSNPVYTSSKMKTPVYTIALGDTTVKKDIILLKTEYNRIVYLGNDFPLEVVVNAKQLKGKSSTLTISKDNNVLFSQVINFNSDAFIQTIPVLLQAKEAGLQHYKVKLSTLPEEMTFANNSNDLFIDVLDGRQKILILTDGPHPDVAALKEAIQKNQNYEVESYTLDAFDKPVKKYELVILYQLPSNKNQIQKLRSDITAAGIPIWIFSGAAQVVDDDFSVSDIQRSNACEPILEKNFPLFTLSDQLRQGISDFPVVACPFGNSTAGSNNVLLYQRIGNIETKTPMFMFNANGESKRATFIGEGIWRWRLQDFAAHGNHNLTDELISKTVQYLSVKTDKSFFRVKGKNNYPENEPVELEAEVYNESYELINTPDVNIVIIDASNKKFPYAFSKTVNAYRLNAGVLSVGEYTYEAKVKVGEKLLTQKGQFSVSALQIELTNTVADHQLLYSLAKNHGGELIYPQQLEQLAEKLQAREDVKSVSYSEKKLDDLLNLKWIFFVILGLISLEWFIRKRNGVY